MPLIQLTYKSLATEQFSESQLASILSSSAKNNEVHQITGMLLYREDSFIGVLEGESAPVLKLMSRIKADPRHESVNVFGIQAINSRDFPKWGMGFHLASDSTLSDHPSVVDFFSDSFDAYNAHIKYGPAMIELKAFADKLEL